MSDIPVQLSEPMTLMRTKDVKHLADRIEQLAATNEELEAEVARLRQLVPRPDQTEDELVWRDYMRGVPLAALAKEFGITKERMRHRLKRIAESKLHLKGEDLADRIEELEAKLEARDGELKAKAQIIEELEAEIKLHEECATIVHFQGVRYAHENMADNIWAAFKDKWEGERKYALRQIVKWLKGDKDGDDTGG